MPNELFIPVKYCSELRHLKKRCYRSNDFMTVAKLKKSIGLKPLVRSFKYLIIVVPLHIQSFGHG